MIITDSFIVLNYPKTGSTFVRTVLKNIHLNRLSWLKRIAVKLKLSKLPIQELLLPNVKMPNRNKDQHGCYAQIPKNFLDREVVSVIRNPYSRFLSTYEFKSWARYLVADKNTLVEKFPSFPELTIDEYCDLQDYSAKVRAEKSDILNKDISRLEIGSQTILFIQMFFKDPKAVMEKISDDYFNSGEYNNDIGEIQFLRQEHLKEDLVNYLRNFDYTEEEITLVENFKRINVTKSDKSKRPNIWTQKAIDHVLSRERHLFKIFEDLGYNYDQPSLIA